MLVDGVSSARIAGSAGVCLIQHPNEIHLQAADHCLSSSRRVPAKAIHYILDSEGARELFYYFLSVPFRGGHAENSKGFSLLALVEQNALDLWCCHRPTPPSNFPPLCLHTVKVKQGLSSSYSCPTFIAPALSLLCQHMRTLLQMLTRFELPIVSYFVGGVASPP